MNKLQSAILIIKLFGWREGLPKATVFLIAPALRRTRLIH